MLVDDLKYKEKVSDIEGFSEVTKLVRDNCLVKEGFCIKGVRIIPRELAI